MQIIIEKATRDQIKRQVLKMPDALEPKFIVNDSNAEAADAYLTQQVIHQHNTLVACLTKNSRHNAENIAAQLKREKKDDLAALLEAHIKFFQEIQNTTKPTLSYLPLYESVLTCTNWSIDPSARHLVTFHIVKSKLRPRIHLRIYPVGTPNPEPEVSETKESEVIQPKKIEQLAFGVPLFIYGKFGSIRFEQPDDTQKNTIHIYPPPGRKPKESSSPIASVWLSKVKFITATS